MKMMRSICVLLCLVLAYVQPARAGAGIWTSHGLSDDLFQLLLTDPSGNLYVGTSHGLFRSTNSGLSWTFVGDSTLDATVEISALAFGSNGLIYVAGNSNQSSGQRSVIYKSVNGGSNWTVVNNGPTGSTVEIVHTLALDAHRNVYAGTDLGVFESSDGGQSWVPANNGLSSDGATSSVLSLTFDAKGNLFAGTKQGAFKSINGGFTWALESSSTLSANNYISSMVVDPAGNIYAGVYGSTIGGNPLWHTGGVFRSSDGGNSWTAANTGFIGYGITLFSLVADTQGNLYAATSDGVYKSSDKGNSWLLLETGLQDTYRYVNAVAVDSKGSIYIAPESDGILKSSDGGKHWTSANYGLRSAQVGAVLVDAAGGVYAGASAGVFKSSDGGSSWFNIADGTITPGSSVAVMISDGNGNIYAAADSYFTSGESGGGIFKSDDGGASWVNIGGTLFSSFSTAIRVNALAAGPGNYIYAGTAKNGVYFSPNGGTSWFPWTDNTLGATAQVNTLALDASGNVYAGTQGGGIYMRSTAGSSWVSLNSALGNLGETLNVATLVFDATGNLYAGLEDGNLYKSTDHGATWHNASHGLNGCTISTMVSDNTRGVLYLGTSYSDTLPPGVYQSVDGGNNWVSINDNNLAMNWAINSMSVGANGMLVVGTDNGPYQYSPLGTATSTFNASATPSGPNSALKLTANIAAASADAGNFGNLYIGAIVPNVKNQLYLFSASGWAPYTGESIPAAATNVVLGNNTVTILDGSVDVSSLVGTTIFAGYGLTQADLLSGQKYRPIYSIH